MAHTPDPDTVFTKPDAPRSDWELFKWMFFEPTLRKRYSKTLSRRQTFLQGWRVYWKFTLPLVLLLYPLWLTFLTAIDLPDWSPESFQFAPDTWKNLSGFWVKWFFLVRKLAGGLVIGLAGGLVFDLAGAWGGGLLMGLTGVFFGGLTGDLSRNLPGGWVIGLIIGLNFELAFSRVLSQVFRLVFGLVLGLVLGLVAGMDGGLVIGWGMAIGIYFGYFRLVLYPFKCYSLFQKNTLTQNPYLHDEGIWLPLPWVKNALRRDATAHPETALRFVDFLLRYRPLQLGLAAELEHVATAARWQSALRLHSTLFDKLRFFKAEELPEKWAKYTPSLAWRNQLGELHETLHRAEAQTAVVLKKDYYEQCSALLEEIEAQLLRETFQGRDAYFSVIAHWKKALVNQLDEVKQDVARVQTVTSNPYAKGVVLSPDTPGNIPVFLDRNDVKEELALKILTSMSMPTFLILGQRRVGKTSLLNFLPTLLDPASFKIVGIDAQSMSGELSVSKWLCEWRYRVAHTLGIEDDAWEPPEDWLEAWDAFADFLRQVTQGSKRRLILAMDEYDEEFGFHHALRQDAARGAALLSRIRAFSQSEKRVVFMFVGATHFSDLPEPKWSKYFVHVHIVRVDYLSEEASLKLIEQPVPGFGLRYKTGVARHIYQLTQGHPHLLHSICSDLVDYANTKNKNPLSHSDLGKILREKTVLKGEQPFTVFWDEFCAEATMRQTVQKIAKRLPVDHELPEVRRLLEYRYIVPDEEGRYRMRVPLFEEWVLKFGY